MNNGSLNGHAERTKLALEVQAEALRPTPPLNGGASLQDRYNKAARRINDLESEIARLRFLLRSNDDEYQKEKARQRRELGIEDEISANAGQPRSEGAPASSHGRTFSLTKNNNHKENNDR